MFNQYILILVWIGCLAFLQKQFYHAEYIELTKKYERRISPVIALIVIAPVIWMAANRGYIADTPVYISGYNSAPTTWNEIPSFLEAQTKDRGFYLLEAIIKVFFGLDSHSFLWIIAIFQGLAVSTLFRKYSCNYVLSIFLFIVSTDYISWMFNGIRQFMAVSILIFGTKLMIDYKNEHKFKRYLKLLLIILLASTMHQSALLMIPFIFLSQGEAWNKKTITFIFVAILAIVFVGRFTNILDNTLQSTQYVNVVSDYTSWDDDGTHPLRVLVYSIPAILSFFGRKVIRKEGNEVINFCVNMSIISAGLYLVSMVTSGIFIGRLPIYCSLYGYILLPWEIDNIFKDSNKTIIKIATVFFYLLFYYFIMHFQYGLI